MRIRLVSYKWNSNHFRENKALRAEEDPQSESDGPLLKGNYKDYIPNGGKARFQKYSVTHVYISVKISVFVYDYLIFSTYSSCNV